MILSYSKGPPIEHQHASLWDDLQDVTRQHPDNIALRCLGQSPADLQWMLPPSSSQHPIRLEWTLTYAQLSTAAETLANGLRRSGIRHGSVLAVFCTGNTAEWVALFWACASLGATFAPINAQFASRSAELRHVITTLQPAGIVALDHRAVATLCRSHPDLVDAEGVLFRLSNGYRQDGEALPSSWGPLSTLAETVASEQHQPKTFQTNENAKTAGQSPILVLFTSGTTAMPKAAAHTDANLLSETALYSHARRIQSKSVVMNVGPGFHILGLWSMLMAWRAGATVLFPSVEFDAAASVKALNEYPVTNFPCSPSAIHAMVSQPGFSAKGYESLDVLSIGSDRVSKELLRKCKSFGATKIINGWGMTECIGVLSCDFDESIPWRGDLLSIGRVVAGSTVKVCAFDSGDVVARGQPGELHVTGTSVVSGYYDNGRTHREASFYDDNGTTWFRTGDAVLMDESGAVYVTGRSKDLIIRGGENIHPGLIEQCINKLESVRSSQVLGIEGDSFGQDIAAVLQVENDTMSNETLRAQVQQAVTSELGQSFRLAKILTLADLGLDTVPVTATGKVRKAELKDKVLQVSTTNGDSDSNSSTLTKVLEVWQQVCGPGSSDISDTTSVNQVADSLIILRFCAHIEKHVGKRISPTDVFEHDTPRAQATLLDSRSAALEANAIDPATILSADQSWITPSMSAKIASTMKSLGLDREVDLEAVYEPHDFIGILMCHNNCNTSGNFRWIFRPQGDISIEFLRECLYRCLKSHANMRSLFMPLENDTITPANVHLVIKPTDRWLNAIVQEVAPVQSEADLKAMARRTDVPFGRANTPAIRAQIVPVQGSQKPGLVMSVHHAFFDAVSIGSFLNDLNACISGKLVGEISYIPYYIFAEMYRLYKGSSLSQRSEEYQLQKLREIGGDGRRYGWPRSRGPMLIAGDDEGWTYMDNSKPQDPKRERVSLDEASGKTRGVPVVQRGSFPRLQDLKSKHGIEAHTLVKAALAIFNVEQTGEDRALFFNCEAGRSWPFVDPWTAQHLPNVMNVAGPLFEASFDFLKVEPTATPKDFFNEIVEEQRLETIHCHASWDRIRQRLGQSRAEFRMFAMRQLTNWDATYVSRAQSQAMALQILDRAAFVDLGVFWNFGQSRLDEIDSFLLYDDVQLSRAEAQAALDRVFAILAWLAEPSHLGSPLAEIIAGSGPDSTGK